MKQRVCNYYIDYFNLQTVVQVNSNVSQPNMISPETKEVIVNRIDLIKRLIKLKSHFQGVSLFTNGINRENHPYMHYSALRNYLALTCFDILGQPADWKDFGSWLNSKSTQEERDKALKLNQSKGEIDKLIGIQQYYNSVYGVKNSFYRFLRDIISEENKRKLMDSIVAKRITDVLINKPDGSKEWDYSEEDLYDYDIKERFLYSIRNSFTHKGISIADSHDAIQSDFGKKADEPFFENGRENWVVELLQFPTNENKQLFFGSTGWPNVLIEIIEDTMYNLDLI